MFSDNTNLNLNMNMNFNLTLNITLNLNPNLNLKLNLKVGSAQYSTSEKLITVTVDNVAVAPLHSILLTGPCENLKTHICRLQKYSFNLNILKIFTGTKT